MKILAIRLKNLASLEGAFEIDFTKEPLYSAGIFAITGPTGAGKSTLLDAICLALFAKTPRHVHAKELGIEIRDTFNNTIGQGDVKGILRKGAVDGYAEIDFVGIDKVVYRSRWSVRRAYNKIEGSLQADSVELFNVSKEKRFPEKKIETLREIERLVGLNFDQFTRSVMLAQGEFTAFLKADKDEKSSLLEKLTGVDIYTNISKQIYLKFTESSKELQRLQDRMEGVIILSDEEIQVLQIQQTELKKQVDDACLVNAGIENEINWHGTFQELVIATEKAKQDHTASLLDLKNAEERKSFFHKVEQVQAIRSQVENYNVSVKNLEERGKEKFILQTKIEELTTQINQFHETSRDAENNKNTIELQYNNAQIEIEKAKELDTRIHDKKLLIDISAKELTQLVTGEQNLKINLENRLKELELLKSETNTLNSWIQQHQSHQSMAENIDWIVSRLSDLNEKQIRINEFRVLIETSQKKDIDAGVQEEQFSIKQHTVKKQFEAIQSEISNIKAILNQTKISDLKNELEKLRKESEHLSLSKIYWEQYHIALLEKSSLEEQQSIFEKELDQNSKDLEEANLKLQEIAAKKDITHKIYEKALRESNKDVEQLRSSLKDGESCPVCGSVHHPYVTESYKVYLVLDTILEEKKLQEQQYEKILMSISALEQKSNNVKNNLQQLSKNKTNHSEKLALLDRQWMDTLLSKECESVLPSDRAKWITAKEKETSGKLKSLQSKLDEFEQQQLKYESFRVQVEQLSGELSEIDMKLLEIRHNHESALAENNRCKKELAALADKNKEIISELNVPFKQEEWYSKWLAEPDSFTSKLISFARKWMDNAEKLKINNGNVAVLSETIKGIENQLKDIQYHVSNARIKHESNELEFKTLLSERATLLHGKTVAETENYFNSSIESATKQWQLLTNQKDNLDREIIQQASFKIKVEETINELEIAIKNVETRILEWLNSYNNKNGSKLELISLQQLLSFTPQWISEEREFFKKLEETITVNKAVWEDRKNKYQEHIAKKTSEAPLDELLSRQAELASAIELLNIQKNECEFRLKQNEQSQQQAGTLKKEIIRKNVEFENWQKLNDLLGSADGKKFRMIAQEYTLDALLSFANVHLGELNSRYQLERVPDSLALQVIDKDMGDEIRSVHSLSGGESFLVSLALALGLALLSSNRMKVESLFIDEGFGSLDPVTLNMVMDALERLKNQGRKVGVISHVQEMTERIHAQIRVTRLANGRSKIEVVGI